MTRRKKAYWIITVTFFLKTKKCVPISIGLLKLVLKYNSTELFIT